MVVTILNNNSPSSSKCSAAFLTYIPDMCDYTKNNVRVYYYTKYVVEHGNNNGLYSRTTYWFCVIKQIAFIMEYNLPMNI